MMTGMPDMRRRTPEPPAGPPQTQFKPGTANELLHQLAPLLAEEGIDGFVNMSPVCTSDDNPWHRTFGCYGERTSSGRDNRTSGAADSGAVAVMPSERLAARIRSGSARFLS